MDLEISIHPWNHHHHLYCELFHHLHKSSPTLFVYCHFFLCFSFNWNSQHPEMEMPAVRSQCPIVGRAQSMWQEPRQKQEAPEFLPWEAKVTSRLLWAQLVALPGVAAPRIWTTMRLCFSSSRIPPLLFLQSFPKRLVSVFSTALRLMNPLSTVFYLPTHSFCLLISSLTCLIVRMVPKASSCDGTK